MTFVALLLGTALAAVPGWLAIRLIEGKTPVLWRGERVVLGFLLGLTGLTFIAFLASLAGLPLNFVGWLVVLGIPTALFKVLLWWRVKGFWKTPRGQPMVAEKSKRWQVIFLVLLGLWSAVKVGSGAFMLLTEPPFFDDTATNWNLRGKIFFLEQKYLLQLPSDDPGTVGGISSYPPSVPLAKAWYATFAGGWSESAANVVHLAWFAAAILLVFWTLRRRLSFFWSALGTYVMVSLPLYLMHGTHPYADVFLSAHLFAAVIPLFHALNAQSEDEASTWLRLSGFAAALLPFTKSEGLILYLPVYLLCAAGTLWMLRRQGTLSSPRLTRIVLILGGLLACVVVPWLLFKWVNGLPFGNAKSVTGLGIGWQPGVVTAIVYNTFTEGNWLLLFPLLIPLLILRRAKAFSRPLAVVTAFTLLAYGIQIPLFLFTSLSVEALFQTGYARGIIHLIPLMIVMTTFLLEKTVERSRDLATE